MVTLTGPDRHSPLPSHVASRTVEHATVREVLMGAQDNFTNVLAVVLGVAIGSGRADFVALAGLSAGVAEAVSMGGVLYNSTRAEHQLERLHGDPESGPLGADRLAPAMSGLVTFVAALFAGLAPLVPFLVLPISGALPLTLVISTAGLFVLGSVTGRLVGERWWREGIRLLAVAGIAALCAALIGSVLQVD
jgi:VIT1/CCC1 family predicted Fe2+/Mn2+ transporter